MANPLRSTTALSLRAQRTRAALVDAGFELLAERPIDAIPIDDVVARAGVAKGSFFNHFADKAAFARAISGEVRRELEQWVGTANAGVTDPVERIAGGMRTCARFALREPRRSAVLLRGDGSSTARAHPLNRGLSEDIAAAAAAGLLRREAVEGGLLYWLGLCQALMAHLVECRPTPAEAAAQLADMLVLGLIGLGIEASRAIAAAQAGTGGAL